MILTVKLDEFITDSSQIEFIAKFIGGLPVCKDNARHSAKLVPLSERIIFRLSEDKTRIIIANSDGEPKQIGRVNIEVK